MPEPMLDEALAQFVVAAQAGDAAARAKVVEALEPTARRVCSAMMAAGPDRDDAVQDTLVRVLERLHTVRDPGRVRGWVSTVAVSVCMSARRRDGRAAVVATTLAGGARLDAEVEAMAIQSVVDAEVRDRLVGFDDRDRVIDLVLRDGYGLSSAEVAERSGRGPAAVRTRNWETRARLRVAMDGVHSLVVGLAAWPLRQARRWLATLSRVAEATPGAWALLVPVVLSVAVGVGHTFGVTDPASSQPDRPPNDQADDPAERAGPDTAVWPRGPDGPPQDPPPDSWTPIVEVGTVGVGTLPGPAQDPWVRVTVGGEDDLYRSEYTVSDNPLGDDEEAPVSEGGDVGVLACDGDPVCTDGSAGRMSS